MLPIREPSGWMTAWILGSAVMPLIALAMGATVFRRSYTSKRGIPAALVLGLGAGLGGFFLGEFLWTIFLGAVAVGAYLVTGN